MNCSNISVQEKSCKFFILMGAVPLGAPYFYVTVICTVMLLIFLLIWTSAGPQPWGGKCHPWKTGHQLFATPESVFAIFIISLYL